MLLFVLILFGWQSALVWQSLSASEPDAPPQPKGLTVQAIVRTPAAYNKTLKVRLKDIARFSGIRDNQLVGYGLVVGLNGTGDTLASSPYTKESLTGMLERLGVNIRDNKVPSGKNVAAVMVTARLPPFAKAGSTVDVVVSALGDAKDLNGGTLLVTPLLGADSEVYAVGQGEIVVSGFSAVGLAASRTTGVPTTGKIPSGAIVEKEIDFQLTDLRTQTLSLRNPDLTTASRVANAINEHFKRNVARAKDSSNVEIDMPLGSKRRAIEALTQIESLEVEPDQVARVVIDPSGVIVMGREVRLSQIALTHGSVTVRIAESASVSQPNPFTQVINPAVDRVGGRAPRRFRDPRFGRGGDSGVRAEGSRAGATDVVRARGSDAGAVGAVSAGGLDAGAADVVRAGGAREGVADAERADSMERAPGLLDAALNSESPLQQATVVKHTDISVTEKKGKFAILDRACNLEELVNGLNLLGVSPREMAQILQSVKAAGALHAEVTVN